MDATILVEKRAALETLRPHQRGQAVSRKVLQREMDWKLFAAFPLSARHAVVVGQPAECGARPVRVMVPQGAKLMARGDPEDRIHRVTSGIFYLGVADKLNAEKSRAYPPGGVLVLQGNTPHFPSWNSGECITQVTAIGPLGRNEISSKDDRRNLSSLSRSKGKAAAWEGSTHVYSRSFRTARAA